MKKVFPFLLLALCLDFASFAATGPRSKAKAKRAFTHNSESGKGKANKAQFRRESIRPVVDLTPHKLETFKTSKAAPHYKWAKAR